MIRKISFKRVTNFTISQLRSGGDEFKFILALPQTSPNQSTASPNTPFGVLGYFGGGVNFGPL